jgi:hypothetical protein
MLPEGTQKSGNLLDQNSTDIADKPHTTPAVQNDRVMGEDD